MEFERLLLRLQEVQCELPGRVKAWLFLDKLKLSENEELALLSSVNNEWCVKRLQQSPPCCRRGPCGVPTAATTKAGWRSGAR